MSTSIEKARFENVVVAFQGDIATAAAILTRDPQVRGAYQRTITAFVADLRQKVNSGQMTWRQAAEEAQQVRNQTMEMVRNRSTPVGRALAEQLKAKGKTLNELIAKYTLEKFGQNARFDALTVAQKEVVYAEIVSAASRSNPRVNAQMLRWSRYGRGLVLLSVAVSVYTVATSETPGATAGREIAITGAGIAGGMAGGAIAGLACGPGAPVCVTIGAFVGGALAALGMGSIF
jgi:hypothetical protein